MIGLMWVLPFLYYHHAYPLTTFYQEWGAATLGLCAMPLLATRRYWRQAETPRITLLPIALMLLVLLQAALGKLAYFEQAVLFTFYMLWAALLVLLGNRLRLEIGLPKLVTVLAIFLILGAELSAFAGILQHYNWDTWFNAVVTVKTSSAIYGNVAQPNHFANYITLGLISLGLLLASKRLRFWQVFLLALPLLFVLVLSGSRSVGLYLLWTIFLTYLFQRKRGADKTLLYYTLFLLLGFGLMHWVVQIPWMAGSTGSVTTVERMLGEVDRSKVFGGGIRFYLWQESWHIFSQFPLLGAGLGQFAWQHFLLLPQLQGDHVHGLYNNAHNLIMHIAAEMGAAGLLILCGTLGAWLLQILRVQLTVYHWWGYAALSVLGIHSLLEYPLWYAHFLGIASIILGILDERVYKIKPHQLGQIKLHRLGRLTIAITLLLGAVTLAQLIYGYHHLENLLALRPPPEVNLAEINSAETISPPKDLTAKNLTAKNPATRPPSAAHENYIQQIRAGLQMVHGQSLFHPYAELFMSGWMEPDADDLENKLALNTRVMRFVPIATVVYRQAWLLALADQPLAAQAQMERAIWSYPNDLEKARVELNRLAQKDPVHFAALLEFTLQKNEEYKSAVR